ncbi:MAG: hypothetical protein AABY16_03105 [Nanoarchaeota archaeon]
MLHKKSPWIFKYPKITVFLIAVVAAYFIFRNPFTIFKIAAINGDRYIGAFIAGLFYSFGFTAPFATGFFLTIAHSKPLFFAFFGGLGALLADLFIFHIVRVSFMDEFTRLEHTKGFRWLERLFYKTIPVKLHKLFLFAIAFVFIASPLPDEIGVTLMAGFTSLSYRGLAIVSFVANTLGIFVLLTI